MSADITTVAVDVLRTGWDQNEPGLSPSTVGAADFGLLYRVAVDGQVYAQPLVYNGTLVVATENNNVYGFDAATGGVTWPKKSLGPPWPAAAIGCGDLTPNIGVTSTPVIDSATGTLYLTCKVNDGPDTHHPHWYMHALDVTTGVERPGWPVEIHGSASNDPAATFNPFTAMQRPGLLLLDGVVYAGFGAHCDAGPYRGWVVAVSTTTAQVSALWTTLVGSDDGAGIWQGGGGLVSDGSDRILFSTGNSFHSLTPPPGPGHRPPGQLGESVVRLGVAGDGSLSARDFFAPANADTLDNNDTDLGSGGPLALPASFGTAAHPHLLVEVGKDGRVFLLDRDNLGGRKQGPSGSDAVVGVTGPFNGLWGHLAFYGGEGGYVYFVGNGGPLRALKYGVDGSANPVLSSAGTSASNFGYTSGSPIVTSDGITPGSGLVWVVYVDDNSGAGAQLRAYEAVPVNGTLALRFSTPIGIASKFTEVATAGSRVFVGTRDGSVRAYGRPASAPVSGPAIDFGSIPVGTTRNGTAVVTANRATTVTTLATSAPFAAVPPTGLPRVLNPGDTLSVPVSFNPISPGLATGALTVSTSTGGATVDLRGTGTQNGLTATPASVDFGEIATSATKSLAVIIANTGVTTTTVTGGTAPALPFGVTGLPATGTSIPSTGSVAVSVTFAPTVAGAANGVLTVTSTTGNVTVPLTGNAVTGQGRLTLAPTAVDLGPVAVGDTASSSFDVSNTGNISLTITKAKAPTGAFTSSAPLNEGLVINPNQHVTVPVTFTPTTTGPASADYEITANDGQGAQHVRLTGTGAPTVPTTVPPPRAGS
ncbi:MAG: choice-of-anchor D domain-containing protein [Pseudonocardiaceae bacterium]